MPPLDTNLADADGLDAVAAWIATLAVTGYLIYASMETLWVWPAMFVHGVVLVHHFSLQHECCHYTVFKTRWLNDVVGNVCGFIIMLPNRHFRYEHCDHHTYTQLRGDDPEIRNSLMAALIDRQERSTHQLEIH